jgi:hypothetical protein
LPVLASGGMILTEASFWPLLSYEVNLNHMMIFKNNMILNLNHMMIKVSFSKTQYWVGF